MKPVLKNTAPVRLTAYKCNKPNGTWDEMRNDPECEGQMTYKDCRSHCIADQNGLCAYCEIDIRNNEPLHCRVEHFHPKSDLNTHHNWALDWQNMLGVCNGGDNPFLSQSGFHSPPTNENLSCDAHKNKMIESGRLDMDCDGHILNPLQLAAFPCLFRVEKSTGKLQPDPVACAANQPSWPGNHHSSLEALVSHTLNMLNLNCDRLCQTRLGIIRQIERGKKRQRQAGYTAQAGLANLARKYFQIRWPGFFTTIRLCLGQPAEECLQSLSFQG